MQPRTARSPRSIEEIKADLEATKDIVRKNLNKALERGEKLKKLSNQTKQLYDEAPLFSRESDRLANWKRYQKNLWSTVLFGATLGILYGLVQGFAWQLLLISAVIGGIMSYSLTKVWYSFRDSVKNCSSLHPLDNIDPEFKRKLSNKTKDFLNIFDPMYRGLQQKEKNKGTSVKLASTTMTATSERKKIVKKP